MGQLPIRMIAVGREQGVAHDRSQRRQMVPDIFAEAGFIVHLSNQVDPLTATISVPNIFRAEIGPNLWVCGSED